LLESAVELRRLGNSDLKIAPIVFGGNVLGWTAGEATSFKILDAFIDGGFNAIDTADTYSRFVPGNKGGESETIIGRWLKQGGGRRERVLVFTKVGHEMGPGKSGLSRRYIIAAVEESLKRLQIDCIDLYQSHRDDPATPMLETMEAYAQLIRQGKVCAIGASNFTAARLKESLTISQAHDLPRYECLQPRFNLYDRADYEGEIEQLCLAQKVGVIPYYGLASGFLTGKYRSPADFTKSPRGARMSAYLNAKGRRILAALDEIAESHRVNAAAVALAWLIARPSITAPIASATNVDQVKDFCVAASLKLRPDEITKLDAAGRE
jgi:aryl-alcohol dehydrogenase-like predicted oxidoreductase